jgi:hypothetical protein
MEKGLGRCVGVWTSGYWRSDYLLPVGRRHGGRRLLLSSPPLGTAAIGRYMMPAAVAFSGDDDSHFGQFPPSLRRALALQRRLGHDGVAGSKPRSSQAWERIAE